MKILFVVVIVLYAASVALQFAGAAFKKDKLLKASWLVFVAAFAAASPRSACRSRTSSSSPLPLPGAWR